MYPDGDGGDGGVGGDGEQRRERADTVDTVDIHARAAATGEKAEKVEKAATEMAATGVSPSADLPLAGAHKHELPIVDREAYSIVAEYGRGGMGRVLVARDRRLGRRVALKELLARTADMRTRFVREALITARLQHPAIVPVHEAGRWPSGEPFYAMKLVSGRPLSFVIGETRTLADRIALLPNVITIAEAIAYAHSQRVIHRDLKPDNVLVGEFGETVVIDWGLAKHLDDTSDDPAHPMADQSQPMTVVGAVIGTPGFMAPEQAAGQRADERTDVYALGAILYTLLAGKPPYGGKTSREIVEETLSGPPVRLHALQTDVPPDLLAIVDKAMARAPSDRYPSARELAADLKRFTTGQLVGAHRYSRAQRLARFVRRHRVALTVGGAALVVLAVMSLVGVRRILRERDRANQERALALEQKAAVEAAQAREAARFDQLILSQARAVLDHDPTATLAWLKRLRPEAHGWGEARVLAAEAQARYVASEVRPGRVAALAPDGAWLATVDGSGAVRLYARDRDGAVELPGRVGAARAVAFAPDGKTLAAGGAGGVRLYDVAARRERTLDGRVDSVAALAFAPDGSILAAAGPGGLRLWDAQGHARPAPTTSGAVTRLGLAAGDRGAARDGAGVVWWQGAESHRLPPPDGGGAIALSSDGTRLAVAGPNEVRIFELPSGRSRRVAVGNTAALAFSPDHESLALCAGDGSLVAVTVASGQITSYAHAGGACHDVTFGSDGRALAATHGSIARIWSLPAGDLRKLRGAELDVDQVALSRDGRWLASASPEEAVRLWRLDGERPPATLALPADRALVALSPDGAELAVGGADGRVRRVRGATTTVVARHATPVQALAWSAAGIVSAARDGVELVPTAPPVPSPPSAEPVSLGPAASALALTRDGAWLATSADGNVRLQRLTWSGGRPSPSGTPRTFEPGLAARTLALSPDGNTLAAAGADARVVHLWIAKSGGHRTFDVDAAVSALAFLDDELLAVGEKSGAIRILHLPTGDGWTLSGHKSAVVALGADAGALTSLSDDGRLRVWPAVPPPGATALRAWLDGATRARFDADDRLR